MTGSINMETAPAGNPMQSLLTSATELDNAWTSAKGTITSAEGGMGSDADILVRPFRETYNITAHSVKKTLPHMPENFRILVNEYQKALDIYLAANKASEQAFPRPR
jgi:hypothetical protein